jgi:hypothetical protein
VTKLIVEGLNPEDRAERARRAVGHIFGRNIQNGPLRMAPEFIRQLLTQDWPAEAFRFRLKSTKDYLTLNRLEVYETEFRHVGSAVWLDNDSLRALARWEAANQ